MHDLLTDPLIGVRTAEGAHHISLPELMAELVAGRIEGYTGVRAHQAEPWHVLLVQLAASIQARRPTAELPTDPGYWRDGLLDLADGKASAWHLVVEDVTQPAFLQHPWSSWEKDAPDYGVHTKRGEIFYDIKARTPDELDVLVTSKNHDVKMARLAATEAQAWLYALMTLQTTSGFLGQGNYGIVRMNGGFASRPIVSWASSLHPSARFVHDVATLGAMRSPTQRTYGYAECGVVLTWLVPWSRDDHQFDISVLEPWFIETPRCVRLMRSAEGGVVALGATTRVRQIGPKTLDNGDVGDPWIPINTADKKKGRSALTLSGDGWTPERLTALIFEQGVELTALQKPPAGQGPGWLLATCLVRGQGTTEGFHQVVVPVPPKARLALLDGGRRSTLGHLAEKLLIDAKEVQKILVTALAVLTEGGPDAVDMERVTAWLQAVRQDFGRRWEVHYFPTLWRAADEDQETVRRDWQQRIVDEAHALLVQASERLPLPTSRAWRAITQAYNAFYGRLRKHGLPWPNRALDQTHNALQEETA